MLKDELSMVENIVVHEARRAHVPDARCAVVDKEERRLVWITIHMGVHDDVVASVVRGHKPLLP